MKLHSFFLLLTTLSVMPPIGACLHPPVDFAGTLGESSQRALIFYRNGYEALYLQVGYHLEVAAKEELPKKLAWVIPVPVVPDAYETVSPDLFTDAESLLHYWKFREKTLGGDESDAIQVVQKVNVGEYEIQALKVTGNDSGRDLNEWLKNNGFSQVPDQNMAYFLKKNWTFLAIKINPAKAKDCLENHGQFHPLGIRFKTPRIEYPLKFSSHQGSFKVKAVVITDKPIKLAPSMKSKKIYGAIFNQPVETDLLRGQSRSEEMEQPRLTTLAPIFKKLEKYSLGAFGKTSYVSYFEGHVNDKGNEISSWEDDFSLETE